MLGVRQRDLPDIIRRIQLSPRIARYCSDDVAEVWTRFPPNRDFEYELEQVFIQRNPVVWEQPVRVKGRYKIPKFQITGRVYFIQGGDLIKIGYAKSPQKRLDNLKTGCAFELTLLASMPGSVKLERHIHERFADLRHLREWFRVDPKLTRFIREVAGWKRGA